MTPFTLALRLHRLRSVEPSVRQRVRPGVKRGKARPPLIAGMIIGVAALLLLGTVLFRHHQKPGTSKDIHAGFAR